MKKPPFLSLLLWAGLLLASSCQKADPQRDASTKLDDARYLVANLVTTDDHDNITGYMVGYGLNQADPGQVSVPCASLENARTLFLSWVPDPASVTGSDDNLSWAMSDTLGVSQGSVRFVPGGDKGAVAHLELPAGFPVVTGVQFLPSASFPQNAELDYLDDLDKLYFGNEVYLYNGDYDPGHAPTEFNSDILVSDTIRKDRQGGFLVIREYDQSTNTSGIVFTPGDKETNFLDAYHFDRNLPRARTKSDIAIVGNHYRKYANYIEKSLGGKVNFLDYWFLCAEKNTSFFSIGEYSGYRYNMGSGDFQSLNLFHPGYVEALIYFFGVKMVDGEYRVVFW